MHFKRNYLAVLISFGAALFCSQARAQTLDSTFKCQTTTLGTDALTKTTSKPIRIVCTSTLAANNKPLYIVDGKPVSDLNFNSINPDDIDKVEVLKEVSAMALYGSRAANGVIFITMKRRASKYIPQPEEKKDHLD